MARYADTGEYNYKYALRRRVANTLKKVIKEEALIDTGTLYDSVRINAKVTTEGNLRIQIVAAYYFGFLITEHKRLHHSIWFKSSILHLSRTDLLQKCMGCMSLTSLKSSQSWNLETYCAKNQK